MKNSRYTVVVIVRVILITLNCFALIWLFTQTSRPATTLFVLVLLLLQTGSLIYYHNRINRDLANFLIFLQENDTTLAFSRKRIERSFRGLIYHLDKINQKLQAARIDRERQFHYLQTVVKQVDTGIIAYDQNGKVEIFNKAAQDILGIQLLHNIDALKDVYPEFVSQLLPVPRFKTVPVKITTKGIIHILALKSGMLKFNERSVYLVSFQDIRPELEAGELNAWRRLIRIQRHEIINSITPITTLTTAIKRSFKKGRTYISPKEVTGEHIENTLNSVEVIEDRSRSLIDFMERFKNLTDVPAVKRNNFQLGSLLSQVAGLFSKELHSAGIRLEINLKPGNLMLLADESLIGQVIINLVKNGLEAIHRTDGWIRINACKDPGGNTIIQVADNGIGIEPAAMESVFVPSYTTKEKGSGIGLSISRQIVHMHNGTITIRSNPGAETVVDIVLPAD
jgi:nitrogen fixation/metabolism regulation signal transduction histidine kinase